MIITHRAQQSNMKMKLCQHPNRQCCLECNLVFHRIIFISHQKYLHLYRVQANLPLLHKWFLQLLKQAIIIFKNKCLQLRHLFQLNHMRLILKLL